MRTQAFTMAVMFFCCVMILGSGVILAQDAPPATPQPTTQSVTTAAGLVPNADPAPVKISMMQMLEWGGTILWITMFLGFVAVAMGLYYFITVTPGREAPQNFTKRIISQIRSGDVRGAYQLCEGRDEMLPSVIRAGLRMYGHDRYVIQEAMESEGERSATALWQKISYLNNIGTIAPLLGLLGTVWGMVLAFNSIAMDNSQVKGMAIAENVSKAMITTVGGLVVAIPCMGLYFFLRGRVVKIIADVEAQSSEVVEVLTKGQD